LACEEPLLGVETLGILGLALEPAKRRPSANPTLRGPSGWLPGGADRHAAWVDQRAGTEHVRGRWL